MTDEEQQRRLVELLAQVPAMAGHAGRTAALPEIAGPQCPRDPYNSATDLKMIVTFLWGKYDASMRWALLLFLDNVLPNVEGMTLGNDLRFFHAQLAEQLNKRIKAAAVPFYADPDYFDLRPLIRQCATQIMDRTGLSVFVIPTSSRRLLRHFCERLKFFGAQISYWKHGAISWSGQTILVEPLHTTVERALEVAKSKRAQLATKHVLLAIYLNETADATALWNGLQQHFGATAFDNHLIVIFGMPADQAPPAGIFALQSPQFTRRDVEQWVDDLATSEEWLKAVAKRWIEVIVSNFPAGNLPIDHFYDQLDAHCKLLNQNQTEYSFTCRLTELEEEFL
jgi:hypothetical protein